jgi:hypothetical protein
MGEQAMVAHADAQTASNAVEHDGHEKRLPGKQEESGYGAYVEQNHE